MGSIVTFVGTTVICAAVSFVLIIGFVVLVELTRHPICALYLHHHIMKREIVRDEIRNKRFWKARVLWMLLFKNGLYDSRITFHPRKSSKSRALLIVDFHKFIPRKIQ